MNPIQPLFRQEIPNNVEWHEIYLPLPYDGVVKRDLSKNFTLQEVVKASFVRGFEKPEFTKIPIDPILPKAAQLIRDALGKPIRLGSTFRSMEWEFYKKRPGTSRHTYGMAWDLNGEGLVDLIIEATNSKNDLYKQLRQLGIGFIRIYEDHAGNFIHMDTRPQLASGEIHVTYEKKKGESIGWQKVDFWATVAVFLTIATTVWQVGKFLYNKFKKK
ncbi:hypothetical protein [uncultured Tenacibaculum sp.]|uniref:hypothetical protein n=1 Tax=uncultured Tenacibaculum sp. TaxID=174713 RepID=UPI002635053F|nr:hypothetical protein [uncultured Tenacibaculum sp.]